MRPRFLSPQAQPANRPSSQGRWAFWAAVALATSVVAACGPTVGDACETNASCGSALTCDLSTPGGYCTRTPCRAGECPDEAVCVEFGAESAWCMRRCDGGEGCRDGLSCLAPSAINDEAACLDEVAGCRFCAVP